MKSNFEEIKSAFIELLKDKNPCTGEYKKVLSSSTETELLGIIKNNLSWCSDKSVCPDSFLAMFTPELLLAAGVANSGKENTGLANTGYRNTGDSNTGYSNTGDRNTGYSNTGDRNTGDWNTGYSNTGDWNTGDWNTGYSNTGDWNTGYRNTGYRNTGDSNTGYSNTGDSNTGYRNTGDRNTGDWNTGDSNTGYSNTGDRNTGAFCTGDLGFPIFNQPSNWTEQQFKESKAYRLLCEVDTKQWIPSSHMSEEEKAAHPSHVTCEGYLKDIPFKESFPNAWHNWSAESKQAFYDLPNFDWSLFTSITGVEKE